MYLIMRTEEVLDFLRMNKATLARMLNITTSSVTQWGEYIPETSAYKIKSMHPDVPHSRKGVKDEQ